MVIYALSVARLGCLKLLDNVRTSDDVVILLEASSLSSPSSFLLIPLEEFVEFLLIISMIAAKS